MVASGEATVMGNPLDSATNSGIFSPGDILPGLSISATSPVPDNDLAIVGVGYSGLANKAVFTQTGNATLNLNFGPGQTAVGLGLVSAVESANFTLSFFSPANGLLGTTTVNAVPNSGSLADRTHVVKAKPSLVAGTFLPLGGSSFSDNGLGRPGTGPERDRSDEVLPSRDNKAVAFRQAARLRA